MASPPTPVSRTTWMLAAATWLAHVGLYLAFAADVGVREAVAAVAVATAATAAVVTMARAGGVRFRFHLRDLVQVWRLPWYIVTGTAQVLLGLWQQLAGGGADSRLATVPFDTGNPVDPAAAGRRALAVTYTTATPNCIVLGLVEDQGRMLYHQILPGPLPTMTRRLGARP